MTSRSWRAVLLCALCLACKDKTPKSFTKSRLAMDTLVTMTLSAESDKAANEAFDAAFAEIARLEALLNFYSEMWGTP